MPPLTNTIAYQGEPGANSDTACRDMYPAMQPLPCPTFEDAFNAVETGKADLAMIPIENTLAGRVADIHHLLPHSRLHIIGEYFLPIHFQLMVLPEARLEDIKSVHSHIHALGQCRKIIRRHRWKPVVAGDTAGAARQIAEEGDPSKAALAPLLADVRARRHFPFELLLRQAQAQAEMASGAPGARERLVAVRAEAARKGIVLAN